MARIVYALTDQGRGHTSRVSAMARALRTRGHDLLVVCGGNARRHMLEQGYEVIGVPVLRQRMHDNRIRLWASLLEVGIQAAQTLGVVPELAERLVGWRPDLLVTDFESFSVRAAGRIGLPVLSFNHQQVLTRTRCEVPKGYRWDAWVAKLVIDTASPSRALHTLVSSFFFPEVIDPRETTLVGPILRRAVQDAVVTEGEEVVVYHNDPTGFDGFLDTLACVDAKFVVYNFGDRTDARRYPNLRFEAPSVDGFLRDVAAARAVISSAGYTLMSEAMYLGKPQLALPNQGIFEQTLNALYLKRDGLGEAVLAGTPTVADVTGFLARADDYAARLRARVTRPGNDAALACIERFSGGATEANQAA